MAQSRFKRFIQYVLIDILLAALISFFLINYVVSAFLIEGDSMRPLLRDQERVLISKLAVRRGRLQRFDLVVFFKPDEPEKSLIKRVIGLPGDVVEIRAKQVIVNGQPLTEPYTRYTDPVSQQNPNQAAENTDPAKYFDGNNFPWKRDFMPATTVPPGSYFVMGDNRDHSNDSRFWGFVSRERIRGKALILYWSWAGFGQVRWERLGKLVK